MNKKQAIKQIKENCKDFPKVDYTYNKYSNINGIRVKTGEGKHFINHARRIWRKLKRDHGVI